MVFDNFAGWAFAPITNNLSPATGVIVITFVITLLITLVYKWMTNQTLMKEMKAEIKELQKKMKDNKENPDKMMAAQKELMSKNAQLMKHSMKPTLVTLLPLLLIFGWLKLLYEDAGDMLVWGFKLPLFGTGFGWLGTYILFALIFSIVLRKIMRVV